MKDNTLKTLSSMVPTRKKLAEVLVDVTYKYDVDAQVFNIIIINNNNNKVRGNM